jgi:hypothetical protein
MNSWDIALWASDIAILNMARGAGKPLEDEPDRLVMKKWMWFTVMSFIGAVNLLDFQTIMTMAYTLPYLAAFMWAVFVITGISTSGLFSILHGKSFTPDGKFWWLEAIAIDISVHRWTLRMGYPLSAHIRWWKKCSFVYSLVRNSLIIPSIIYLQTYAAFILILQGFILYLCGKVWYSNAVRLHEGIIGLLIVTLLLR